MHSSRAYTLLLQVAFVTLGNQAIASDIFVGKFASVPSKFFGADDDSLELHITRKGEKYLITEFAKGEFKLDYLAVRCDSKKDLSMPVTAAGEVYALCTERSGFEKFVYSQNGIDQGDRRLSALREQPGERVLEASYFRHSYYMPPFFAFRRVDAFKSAPNDPAALLSHETPDFIALCAEAGVKLHEKPVAPVRSIAYDFDPKRISGWSGALRVEVDEDGRASAFGGFSKHNSKEATKRLNFEFTERRALDGAGAASINGTAPYYRFPAPSARQPYYGVDALSADVLAFLDVDKPGEYRKAPVAQGAIRYRITLTDRRSGAVLGVQTFVVDRLNHRACGVNVDRVISPSAFIFDAINR